MLSGAQKAELKLKYGEDTVYVEEKEGTFVFRKPSAVIYRQFLNGISSPDKKSDRALQFEQLCIQCLVGPEVEPGTPDYQRLQAMIERIPGCVMEIGGELTELASGGDAFKVGKL